MHGPRDHAAGIPAHISQLYGALVERVSLGRVGTEMKVSQKTGRRWSMSSRNLLLHIIAKVRGPPVRGPEVSNGQPCQAMIVFHFFFSKRTRLRRPAAQGKTWRALAPASIRLLLFCVPSLPTTPYIRKSSPVWLCGFLSHGPWLTSLLACLLAFQPRLLPTTLLRTFLHLTHGIYLIIVFGKTISSELHTEVNCTVCSVQFTQKNLLFCFLSSSFEPFPCSLQADPPV